MRKEDVTAIFEMEDLIPIVGRLVDEFTSRESSSVSYERAKQFMEAVIYCIAHSQEGDSVLVTDKTIWAEEVYRQGFLAVEEKVRETQKKYNELIMFFDSYGNRNYRDTVEKALPGFFLHYDVKYAPTENIITMDYPVFGLDMSLEGIDMIRQYIDVIWEEQCYLMKFPREYVISELRSFHPHYEKEYFNLKEILGIEMAKSDG